MMTIYKYLKQAIDSAISNFGENALQVSTFRNNLAKLLVQKNMALAFRLSDDEKADNSRHAYELLELSRITVERNNGLYSERMAGIYNNLAFMFGKNNHVKKLEMFLKSLDIVKRLFNENDPRTQTLMKNIGSLYQESGNYKEAFNYLEKGFLIELFYDKEARPNELNSTFSELKKQLLNSRDYETLIEYCNRILKIKKHHLSAMETLGDCYIAMGNHNMAYDQFKLIYDEFKLGNPFLSKLIKTAVNIGCITEAIDYYVKGISMLKDKELYLRNNEFTKAKNKEIMKSYLPDNTRRSDSKEYQEKIKSEINQLRNSCLKLAKKHNKMNELPDWLLAEN
jgi:tetratricopeptide (TPR) repeat protein